MLDHSPLHSLEDEDIAFGTGRGVEEVPRFGEGETTEQPKSIGHTALHDTVDLSLPETTYTDDLGTSGMGDPAQPDTVTAPSQLTDSTTPQHDMHDMHAVAATEAYTMHH